jgi:hypothetical protein
VPVTLNDGHLTRLSSVIMVQHCNRLSVQSEDVCQHLLKYHLLHATAYSGTYTGLGTNAPPRQRFK